MTDECKTCKHNKGNCALGLFPHPHIECPEHGRFVEVKKQIEG